MSPRQDELADLVEPRRAHRARPGAATGPAAGGGRWPERRLCGAALAQPAGDGTRARRRDRRRAGDALRRDTRARRAPGRAELGTARRRCDASRRAVAAGGVRRPSIPALYATLKRALGGAGPPGRAGPGRSGRTSWRCTRRCSRRTTRPASATSWTPPSARLIAYDRKRGAELAADAAELLRLQPERQDHGAAPGHPRQHGAPAAGHHRGAAGPLGQCGAGAGDSHGPAPVEPERGSLMRVMRLGKPAWWFPRLSSNDLWPSVQRPFRLRALLSMIRPQGSAGARCRNLDLMETSCETQASDRDGLLRPPPVCMRRRQQRPSCRSRWPAASAAPPARPHAAPVDRGGQAARVQGHGRHDDPRIGHRAADDRRHGDRGARRRRPPAPARRRCRSTAASPAPSHRSMPRAPNITFRVGAAHHLEQQGRRCSAAAAWTARIPNVAGNVPAGPTDQPVPLARGYATFASDSGHQANALGLARRPVPAQRRGGAQLRRPRAQEDARRGHLS